jgi:hypothetical protein
MSIILLGEIDMPDDDKIKTQVEAEFQGLEVALLASNPGILDVLQVYGGYDEAVKQADAYLAVLKPATPGALTTNRS